MTQLENDFQQALLIGFAIPTAVLVLAVVWLAVTWRRPPGWASAYRRASQPLQVTVVFGVAILLWALATGGGILVVGRATGHDPLGARGARERLSWIAMGLVLSYGAFLLVSLLRSLRRWFRSRRGSPPAGPSPRSGHVP